ncbi:hypothetical protein [Thalassospira sp. TSL5-1]|uniref:hypothetical protein n=1 Tax=Thalassospira sp. TSL5-1 TaxID=1544451 RepID=UPI0009406508|nr:hypothetical protein [Thalassospira sp. TSL5-1]OKH86555.1 hypothetical protein LF95_21520 [Thalassospira sp. TSL5-1]
MTIRHLACQFNPDAVKSEMASWLRLPLSKRQTALRHVMADPLVEPVLDALRVDTDIANRNINTAYGALLASLRSFAAIPGLSDSDLTPLIDWLNLDKTALCPTSTNPARGRKIDDALFNDLTAPSIASDDTMPEQAGILLPRDVAALGQFLSTSLAISDPTRQATHEMLANITTDKNGLLVIIDQ